MAGPLLTYRIAIAAQWEVPEVSNSAITEALALPMDGYEVAQCCFDYRVSLNLLGEGPDMVLVLASDFSLMRPRVAAEIIRPEGDVMSMASVLHLLRLRLAEAKAYPDGGLEISFVDGSLITMPADPHYEAWQVTRRDGYMVIPVPSAGLAVWPGDADMPQ